jgi:endonuclease III
MSQGWLVGAAQIVLDEYQGNAGSIWSDEPTAAELRKRLEAFPGIAQKKAAMAVELLTHYRSVSVQDLSGSDIAYDVHVRRVFLRTGLAQRDDVHDMVAAARSLYPERPGALEIPTWDATRQWCRPKKPDCLSCPLNAACPRLIDRASHIKCA